ncbi:MAG: hypothetical protein JOZ14_10585 [Acidobacteria bacterium]|nr:hypothetical protein [Acidobacteriota bacterium]
MVTRNLALLALAVLCTLLTAYPSERNSLEHSKVETEMHNIFYHFSDSIYAHIIDLQGELVPAEKNGFPIFDDANSFQLVINSASISITIEALTNTLNQYVLAAPDAPLKEIRISRAGDKLKIRGHLHSKGDVAFETVGSLAVTPQGEIRVHTEKIKAGHIPVKGLLDLLGKTISNLLDTRKLQGLRAEKDDLILTPGELFPPPRIQGRLRAISVRGNDILQEYGTAQTVRTLRSGNYMAYRGGRLRFGKLTMADTDLVLIDMDPQDPFDFYLSHYVDQLVAGYTKTTPTFGLRCFFRDYNKLSAHERSRAKNAKR